MGKATLAHALAGEMKVKIHRAYTPHSGEPANVARLLTELDERDIFLIEQIESIKGPTLETLLAAVDDFTLELITARESRPRSLSLKRFTLVGTTSKPWEVDKRLRRWMIRFDFAPYSAQEIGEVIKSAGNLTFDPEAATLLAQYCEGTPGNARVMVKRLSDYINDYDYATDHVNVDLARAALGSFGYIGKPSTAADLASTLCSMTATAFEEFIVSLFRDLGYRIEMTPEIKDSGIDLLLEMPSPRPHVVLMSGDKLLGGPQAGLLAGRRAPLAAMRKNPLYRALRVDKMTLAALDAVLLEHESGRARETVPVLAMLSLPRERIHKRALAFAKALEAEGPGFVVAVIAGASAVGGGAAPTLEVPTWLVAVTHPAHRPHDLHARLRAADPAVLARVAEDTLLLDLRTVAEEDESVLRRTLRSAAV
jgi:hypothetical protein